MANVHTVRATYKRTSINGISKFVGNNFEKISIDRRSIVEVELIECQEYLLMIFKATWESYITHQLGALKNIISIELITD